MYKILAFAVLLSACPRQSFPEDVPSETELSKADNVLSKKALVLSDETRKVCSTATRTLNRADSDIGEKVRQIILNAGELKVDHKRSLCAEVLARELHTNMQTQKADSQASKEFYYDIVVVGSGVHAAIFNATQAVAHPENKILVIDKSSVMAEHFRSKAFRINSPINAPLGQTNTFPNAPIQIEEFEWFEDAHDFKGYPYAQAIWNETVLANFSSRADFLLGVEAKQIMESKDGSGYNFVIDANEFGTIRAKKLVISSGLGTPKLTEGPGDYIASQKKLAEKCKYDNCLPTVMTFDDMLAIDAAWTGQNKRNGFKNVVEAIANKAVALVGGGDSSYVVWEYLYLPGMENLTKITAQKSTFSGRFYTSIERDELNPIPAKMFWIGTPFTNKDEFNKLVATKAIKKRYDNILTLSILENLSILDISFREKQYLSKVVPTAPNKVTIHFEAKDGRKKSQEHDVDHVIISTGYDNSSRLMDIMSPLLSEDEKNKNWNELFQFININGKQTARRLECVLGSKEVYLIGTAAGVGPGADLQLATPDDLAASIIKNAASINVLGPYTERFGRWLDSK